MIPRIDRALVVHVVLTIEDETAHAGHFWHRDIDSGGLRSVGKYLDGLPEIRRLQAFIVERAERARVPVVDNGDIEAAIGTVMELVLASVDRVEAVP